MKSIKLKINGNSNNTFIYDVILEFTYYHKPKNIAIRAMDANPEDPGQVCMCTINLDAYDKLPDYYVYIRDYSETKGILNSLIEAGIVEKPAYYVNSGYVKIPVCKLTQEAIKEYLQ